MRTWVREGDKPGFGPVSRLCDPGPETPLRLSFPICSAGLKTPLTTGRNNVKSQGRDCWARPAGGKFGQSAQVPCPSAPSRSHQTPPWTEGPGVGGGGLAGGWAGIWPRALPQSKSRAHVTIGSGLMKLSTDGYFVVVL